MMGRTRMADRHGATVLLCLVALCAAVAEAKIQTLKVEKDDRSIFHISSFGFEPRGYFQIDVSGFQVLTTEPGRFKDKDKELNQAFVLQFSTTDASVPLKSAECFHTAGVNVNIDQIWPVTKSMWLTAGVKHFSRNISSIQTPGYYHLYFSNCEPLTAVTFQLKLTEYNLIGMAKSYLSAGETSLPTWFFLICIAFVVEAVVWLNILRKHSDQVRNIHHLMTLVLLFKMASLFFEAFEYHYIKTTGTPHGWNVAYYIFSFVKGMLLFSVIILIGTGWSYLKPFLTDRDKQIMLAILVVQAMVNLSLVVLDETSPGAREWLTWRDIFHLLDMVCCCLILLPIVWSIRHLRDSAEADGKAARNMERLQRFRKFYLLVVLYIYFTRIIVFLLSATLPFEWVWLGTVLSEVASLIFYGTTGYLFRPQEQNPYLALKGEDDDQVSTEMQAMGL